MYKYQLSSKPVISIGLMLLMYFAFCTHVHSENIVTLEQIKPDYACGPKCLYVLMQITGAGKPDCGIRCIYEIIGKEPFIATNLKDLKDAARKLGFLAKGYKLSFSELQKVDGYVILPIGRSTGKADNPLHFVLVKQATTDYVTMINTDTLKAQALQASDFQQSWNGFALVISAAKGQKQLHKHPDNLQAEHENTKPSKYDRLKNLGHADSGSVLEHTFIIPDEKANPDEIKIISKSCSCLTTNFGRDTKGQTTLNMGLRVDKPGWQQAHVDVSLGPETTARYTLRAYGKDTFETYPQIAHIEAPDGGVVEYPVRIDYFTDTNDIVKFDRLESTLPNLKAGGVESENSIKDSFSKFTFHVPLILDAGKNTTEVRNEKGAVTFVFITVKGQRFIPMKVTAKIGTVRYRLTPEKVFVIASKSGEPTSRKVKVEFLAEPLPADIGVQSDDALPIQVQATRVNKESYMLELTVEKNKLQDISLGMNKSRIIIEPKGASELDEIILPVSMFIRQ